MRRAGVVAVVLGAVLLAFAGRVGAATLGGTGWWWRLPAAAPSSEPGGLVVAGAPDGATAIAAVRFQLEDGESAPVLVLGVDRQTAAAPPVIAACFAGSAWQPETGGAWDHKPTAACSRGAVNGILASDGASYSFPLQPLVLGQVVDVVIVPGVVDGLPAGANGSVFELALAPPRLQTEHVGAAGRVDVEPLPAPEVVSESVSPAFTAPAADSAPAFVPALMPKDQEVRATAPINAVPIRSLPAPDSGTPVLAAAWFLIVAGLIAIGWNTDAAARLLGRAPAPVVDHGIGRFRQARTGSPPVL
jgi:hypothetical protein